MRILPLVVLLMFMLGCSKDSEDNWEDRIVGPEDAVLFNSISPAVARIGDTITKGMVVADILENDLLVEYQGQKVIVPGLSDVNP